MDAGPKQDLWNLLPVIIVLLLGAAYFAIMETAFSSASRIRLKAAADHGNRRAGQALYVLDHFDQAITTLLIGTNILHLTIATLVTVAVQRMWGMWAVTAATLVTTVVVFFAGEMLPKSIAKKYAERLAMATARSLRFFMVLFHPLSVMLTAIGNAAARCIRGEPAVTVTEDELADIIENMTDDGELTAERGELMSSALSFAEVPVESVITARVDVAAVDVDDPPEEILAYVREQRHSRLPVYADSVDNVIGILQIRKYIKACIKAGRQGRGYPSAARRAGVRAPEHAHRRGAARAQPPQGQISPSSPITTAARSASSPWRTSLRSSSARSGTRTTSLRSRSCRSAAAAMRSMPR